MRAQPLLYTCHAASLIRRGREISLLLGHPDRAGHAISVEFIESVVKILGYIAFAAGLLLGVLNLEFAIVFFLAAVGLGALLSTAAVFLEELHLERYRRRRDLLKLTAHSVLENFGYRQVNTSWRVTAIVSLLRKNQPWGAMERKVFAGEKPRFSKHATRSPNPREETILR